MKILLKPATPVCVFSLFLALAAGQALARIGMINPNLAGTEELLRLPHLNETLVETIAERRPFLSMLELHALLEPSLSEPDLQELYARLFIPVNLNTASREEILLIPGMGPRMAHEFEEYRPYRAISQFRREIGKYVDDDEVARLEQYVFVPMDLNSASSEDLHTIPGVGDRMVREFEEYRPYVNMAQFRREMGKYVDDAEVARLERYFVIRQ